jgi:hypothetical protein
VVLAAGSCPSDEAAMNDFAVNLPYFLSMFAFPAVPSTFPQAVAFAMAA